MPGVKFDDRISWADIVSFGSAAVVGLWVVFGVMADINVLQAQDDGYEKRLARIESESVKRDDKIIEEFKSAQEKEEERFIRMEKKQEQQFDKLDEKLDKLIERELNGNGS